jgi:hypothetical protein
LTVPRAPGWIADQKLWRAEVEIVSPCAGVAWHDPRVGEPRDGGPSETDIQRSDAARGLRAAVGVVNLMGVDERVARGQASGYIKNGRMTTNCFPRVRAGDPSGDVGSLADHLCSPRAGMNRRAPAPPRRRMKMSEAASAVTTVALKAAVWVADSSPIWAPESAPICEAFRPLIAVVVMPPTWAAVMFPDVQGVNEARFRCAGVL